MDPLSLQSLNQINLQQSQISKKISPNEAQSAFATSLKHAIDDVNKAQVESNIKTEQLAKGEIDNLHDVMITSQKASITLQTAVQVQGKVIDAYKEIMRMQV